MSQPSPKWWGAAAIAGTVLLIDALTKWWVRQAIELGHSVPLLGDWVRLTYVVNPGAAFGLHLGQHSRSILTVLALLALVVIVIAVNGTPATDRFRLAGLGLVGGGATGNLLDRVGLGAVVDFMDVGFGPLRWPVFNVADVGVTLGAIVLVMLLLEEVDTANGRRP